MKPLPAVVCIPGGAWRGRVNNDRWNDYMGAVARFFSSKGILGLAISYRNGIQPGEERTFGNTQYEIMDLYEDCVEALRFIGEHADNLGVDTEKIGVLGDSAGGHLALCTGVMDCLNNHAAKPRAVVACNPITTFMDEKWNPHIIKLDTNPLTRDKSRKEIARMLSPLENITKQLPPMLLMHGTADTVVDMSHSVGFQKEMLKKSNHCELELLNGARHAFILPGYYKDSGTVVKALETAYAFFIRQGF